MGRMATVFGTVMLIAASIGLNIVRYPIVGRMVLTSPSPAKPDDGLTAGDKQDAPSHKRDPLGTPVADQPNRAEAVPASASSAVRSQPAAKGGKNGRDKAGKAGAGKPHGSKPAPPAAEPKEVHDVAPTTAGSDSPASVSEPAGDVTMRPYWDFATPQPMPQPASESKRDRKLIPVTPVARRGSDVLASLAGEQVQRLPPVDAAVTQPVISADFGLSYAEAGRR